ncbi:MAG: dicarboxylate/amino acid:cation symporter [Myxococcaceae bacterium]|nr:dicarboxylate/amino acid:cation symporter [Myxococcaceae bacterium]MBH2005986.1 dicarboxylate/amino acid:cation symporter [Myxococcaceae bacterium]
MSRPLKIILGLCSGIFLGLICHQYPGPWLNAAIAYISQPLGQLFMRLIFMIVVPLVFSSLILGIFELQDFKQLGRVGVKTLIYTVLASFSSVLVGLAFVSIFKPGEGLDPEMTKHLGALSEPVRSSQPATFTAALVSLIPKNPIASAANALEGDMLSLMIFTLIFGAALLLVRGDNKRDPLVACLETVRAVSMKIVDFAMSLAPLGVAALMFTMTAQFGLGLIANLGKYTAVVIAALAFQQFIVFGLILKLLARKSPWQFFSQIKEVMLTALSTASSNATLPTSIRVAENNLKLNRNISSFVLTIGSAANQNGTALFEGVTVLFLAQLYGIHLGLDEQLVVLFMSVVAGMGTAGVPGGSIPMMMIVLQTVGVPAEGIGLILGVDRILDMCRTVLNVSGDLVCAQVIQASESKNQ